MDPVVGHIARYGLAALFAASALHKLRDLRGFAEAVAGYALLPRVGTLAAGALIAAAETLACGLLLTTASTAGALLAAALLGLYSAAIAVNLARGRRDIDCGCLGPASRSQPLSGWLLARNALLGLAAFLAALPVSERALGGVDVLSIAGGVGASVLVFVAASELVAHGSALAAGPTPNRRSG